MVIALVDRNEKPPARPGWRVQTPKVWAGDAVLETADDLIARAQSLTSSVSRYFADLDHVIRGLLLFGQIICFHRASLQLGGSAMLFHEAIYVAVWLGSRSRPRLAARLGIRRPHLQG